MTRIPPACNRRSWTTKCVAVMMVSDLIICKWIVYLMIEEIQCHACFNTRCSATAFHQLFVARSHTNVQALSRLAYRYDRR